MQWADTSCPVCRYCLNSEGHASYCSVCSSAADLWICLICGHIGCGRYRGGHATNHWKETDHCYALELETQRVQYTLSSAASGCLHPAVVAQLRLALQLTQPFRTPAQWLLGRPKLDSFAALSTTMNITATDADIFLISRWLTILRCGTMPATATCTG